MMNKPPYYVFPLVETQAFNRLVPDQLPKAVGVVAPIGYGKTLLLSSLYKKLMDNGSECYWLGLDERNSTAESVIKAILSCKQVNQEPQGRVGEIFLSGLFNFDDTLDQLLVLLSEISSETIFIIDNLNVCEDENLHKLIDAIIFKTNEYCKFVWSTTVAIDANIGKATLNGLYLPIGIPDLSMNEEDVCGILGGELSERLGPDFIKKILINSEGWPAGIRLAKILLSKSTDYDEVLNSLSGSDEYLASMMKQQIIYQLDATFSDFLFCLCHLRVFSKEMCRYVFEIDESGDHIDKLINRNIFIIPIDRNQDQYRLHSLFRDFLITAGSEALSKERLNKIFSRASIWCAKHENWHDAIEYAFSAGELSRVSQMLTLIGNDFVREQGDIRHHMQWIIRLQNAGEPISLETHYWLVWALVFQRNYEHGRVECEILTEHYRRLPKDYLIAKDFQQRLEHISMCIDLFTDNLDGASTASAYAISKGENHDRYTLSSVMCIQSICLANRYDFNGARSVMAQAEPIMREMGGEYSASWISIILGFISNLEGNFNESVDELLPAMNQAKQCFGAESAIYGSLAGIASNSLVQLGRDEEARKLFSVVVKSLGSNLFLDSAALGIDAIVKLWKPSVDEDMVLQNLRKSVRNHPPRLSFLLSCSLISRFLELGDVESALTEAKGIDIRFPMALDAMPNINISNTPHFNDQWTKTKIYLLIASRQYSSALALIDDLSVNAKKYGRNYRSVTLDIARAVISFQLGKQSDSGRYLIFGIKKASRLGIVRPFSAHNKYVQKVAGKSKISLNSFAHAKEKALFKRLLGVTEFDVSDTKESSDEILMPIIVPLTKRESELLMVLDKGLSNSEIADYKDVSEKTIKWHFKNIYKKLGVANRTAAVSRARELGLIG